MSSLRIISGIARGRKLRSVPGDTTRPITDRAKEALFNVLGADIVGASFLDLFSGSGSVGIEALSRGASHVLFIDINRLPIETIRANLKKVGLDAGAEVLRMDAFTLLQRAPSQSFDYVFIAPPQYQELWKKAVLTLDQHPDWMGEDAWVIVQIHQIEYQTFEGDASLKNIREFQQRRYGSTLFVFFERI